MRVYWVEAEFPGRLAIVERPAGDHRLPREIKALRAAGVDILVSMLTYEENVAWGLLDEQELCEKAGMRFVSLPIRDHGLPSSPDPVHKLVDELRAELRQGKSIGFHCWAGIGRSSLMLASVLSAEGWSVPQAFTRISHARGYYTPDTAEQFHWVEAFAEKQGLGDRG
jgi:protein-tyrosine phosphatase